MIEVADETFCEIIRLNSEVVLATNAAKSFRLNRAFRLAEADKQRCEVNALLFDYLLSTGAVGAVPDEPWE